MRIWSANFEEGRFIIIQSFCAFVQFTLLFTRSFHVVRTAASATQWGQSRWGTGNWTGCSVIPSVLVLAINGAKGLIPVAIDAALEGPKAIREGIIDSCVTSYPLCACDHPHELNASFQHFLRYCCRVSVVLFWKQIVRDTVEYISS